MRRTRRTSARRLRAAVERLPRHTREAMIRGIDSNRIVVGAYVDPRSGGVCPMLAAHRNGGRTDVASFARAWDEYTDARRPRRATRREVRTLREMLLESLDFDTSIDRASIAELAAQIRAEREAFRCAADVPATADPAAPEPLVPEEPDERITVHPRRPERGTSTAARFGSASLRLRGDRDRAAELEQRPNWSWLRPVRRHDDFKDLLAAAEEQLSEQRAGELLGDDLAASR